GRPRAWPPQRRRPRRSFSGIDVERLRLRPWDGGGLREETTGPGVCQVFIFSHEIRRPRLILPPGLRYGRRLTMRPIAGLLRPRVRAWTRGRPVVHFGQA